MSTVISVSLRPVQVFCLTLMFCLVAFGTSRAAVSAQFWPDSLNFGEIPTGATVTRTFWVKNTGTDSLEKQFVLGRVSWVSYSYSPQSIAMASGDSIEISLSISALSYSAGAQTRVFFGFLIDGQETISLDIVGPVVTYSEVPSGLYWSDSQFNHSLHEQWLVVWGSRTAALSVAQLRVVPDSGVTVRKIYADQDSFMVGVNVDPLARTGYYKLLFTDGVNTLDSLHFEVVESRPRIYQPYGELHFGSQNQLDTLEVRGLDIWPGCEFRFSLGCLSILSVEHSLDTLARLVVRLDQATTEPFDTLQVKNADSKYFWSQLPIPLFSDALPLAPESGSPGAALPRAFSLGANCPNPFNPSTTISYSVGGEAPVPVRLNVFNVRGQIVAALVDRVVAPGQYTVNWDGRGRGGEQLSSGVYFYRLRAGDFSFTRKMVLLK